MLIGGPSSMKISLNFNQYTSPSISLINHEKLSLRIQEVLKLSITAPVLSNLRYCALGLISPLLEKVKYVLPSVVPSTLDTRPRSPKFKEELLPISISRHGILKLLFHKTFPAKSNLIIFANCSF